MVAMAAILHTRKWRPSTAYNCYIIYSLLSGSGHSDCGPYKYNLMWMLQRNDKFMTPAFFFSKFLIETKFISPKTSTPHRECVWGWQQCKAVSASAW